MQQLSAKNGNGNKSSCSFRLPVSPLKARQDSFIRLYFPLPGQESVCQWRDSLQVYLSWQRWISEQRAGSVQASCWGDSTPGTSFITPQKNPHQMFAFSFKARHQYSVKRVCLLHRDQFGNQCAWISLLVNTPMYNHKLSINVCLHCIGSHVGGCSCVGEVDGWSNNLACAISAGGEATRTWRPSSRGHWDALAP